MKVALRFIWMLIFFLLVEVCIFLPLYILGVLLFPVFNRYAAKAIIESNIWHGWGVLAFRAPWLNEWLGNREDGLNPTWWQKRGGTNYTWFLRNPVTNMRFWKIISTVPRPEDVGWVGSLDHKPADDEHGWFFCWEGLYAGIYYQGRKYGCWFGWKTIPDDRDIHAYKSYRYYGLGIASMIWKVK